MKTNFITACYFPRVLLRDSDARERKRGCFEKIKAAVVVVFYGARVRTSVWKLRFFPIIFRYEKKKKKEEEEKNAQKKSAQSP